MKKNKILMVSLVVILLGYCLLNLTACTGSKIITIKPDTRVEIEKKSSTKPVTATSKKKLSGTWSEDKPVSISSDQMIYYDDKEETVFTGKVKVIQEGLALFAPYLKVNAATGQAKAMQGIRLVDQAQNATIEASELTYKHDLSHVTAKHNVEFITEDDDGHQLILKSDQLVWQPKAGDGQAKGHVAVYYKNTSATAGVMDFSDKQKKVVLKSDPDQPGNRPTVIQAQDKITGDQITLVINEKTYIVSGKAEANINPEQQDGKGKK